MTFSALTGPIRWVARLSARLLTALALMSLLLAPSAARAAEPAPDPRGGQSVTATAAAREELAEPVPAATRVHIGCAAPAAAAVADLPPHAAPSHPSTRPGAAGCRAPPAPLS